MSRTFILKYLNMNKLNIFVFEIILLIIHYFISPNLFLIRILLGIISYMLIPGYLVINFLDITQSLSEILGLSLLFGFTIQVVIITILWGFNIDNINIMLLMPIITIIINIFFLFISHVGNINIQFKKRYLFSPIFIILIISICARSYYFFTNSSSIGIDGALYCDFARKIATNEGFTSNIINDGSADPYFNVKGFSGHPLTVFSIASFFLIGDVSYNSAKIATFFIGIIVVILIYYISESLFDKEVALIAGVISGSFPLLSYYSTILHGPEILSAFFALASILFFITGMKNDSIKLRCMAVSGLFAAFSHGAWGIQIFIPLVLTLFFTFIIFNIKNIILSFYSLFLLVNIFFIYKLSAILFIQFSLTVIIFFCLFIIYRKHIKWDYLGITIFSVIVILSFQILFIRSYLNPEIYITSSLKEFFSDPSKVINPFSFTYGIQNNINYIISTYNRFWQSLIIIITPLIFGFSIASIISPLKLKEKLITLFFPLIFSILFVILSPENVIWFGDILPDRFLILPCSFLIITSAVTINTLLKTEKNSMYSISFIKRKIKFDIKIEKRRIFMFLTFIVVLSSLIPAHIEQLNKFNESYANVLDWYGSPTLNWIKNNSSQKDVFLAADPRRLAWETNRTFIGMTIQSSSLNAIELNNLIQLYNINYVIIDDFLIRYSVYSDFIKDLYNGLNNRNIYPILSTDENNILDNLALSNNNNITINCKGLKLVFESSINSRITRIYKVINIKYLINIMFKENNFENGWIPEKGCNFSTNNKIANISTSEIISWAYIYMNKSISINPSEYPFMAVKVRGNNQSATNFWIAIIGLDNNWYKVPSDTPTSNQFQIYNYNIGSKVGIVVNNIYLGVSGGYQKSVEYEWIIIYNLVIK